MGCSGSKDVGVPPASQGAPPKRQPVGITPQEPTVEHDEQVVRESDAKEEAERQAALREAEAREEAAREEAAKQAGEAAREEAAREEAAREAARKREVEALSAESVRDSESPTGVEARQLSEELEYAKSKYDQAKTERSQQEQERESLMKELAEATGMSLEQVYEKYAIVPDSARPDQVVEDEEPSSPLIQMQLQTEQQSRRAHRVRMQNSGLSSAISEARASQRGR
eukprot:Hpha_TRINITY_DN34326_c0_g1::TRINITY_DN34326_c0_g1_i1::g.109511::m.109511